MSLTEKIKEVNNKCKIDILQEQAKINAKYTDIAIKELSKEYEKYVGRKIEYLDFKNLVIERIIIHKSVFEFSVGVSFHCSNITKKGTVNKTTPSVRVNIMHNGHLIKFLD